MERSDIAADQLFGAWQAGRHIEGLPQAHRPASRAQGYSVQALWPRQAGRVGGWKIAATSVAGQKHIGVSGPLAGPVFAHRVQGSGAQVSLAANRMRVAECEIVFHFARTLAPQAQPRGVDEVLAAVGSVGPGIEVPDSRFLQFEVAGEAQLIADCACSNDMLVGPALPLDDRVHALADLAVHARVSDGRAFDGVGRNVLGDPVAALVWLVNELSANGQTLEAGQFVTTGACVVPIPVEPGQRVEADFGWLGRMQASFA